MTANVPLAVPDLSYEPGFTGRFRVNECYGSNKTAICQMIVYGSLDDWQRTDTGELIIAPDHADAADALRIDIDWVGLDYQCPNHSQVDVSIDP